MTHTPPSEAAASSPSPYLSQSFLESSARCDCGAAACVLSAELLRMRAQCPPTAEVEKLREAARSANALRLHLSNINSALFEAGRPHRHKGDDLERIRDLAGERDAWRHQANRRGDDLNRIRALVPLAAATGQPRTEVPVGPDCSGTVVELGEAFRRNLANAVDCLPSDGHPIDAGTIKLAIRNLHAAVAELAKVVERIVAR